MSSNTLNNLWTKNRYRRNAKFHVDFDCIVGKFKFNFKLMRIRYVLAVIFIYFSLNHINYNFSGGQIHDIHASFLNQYAETKEPINIIISCGVENLIRGETPWSIIFQVKL